MITIQILIITHILQIYLKFIPIQVFTITIRLNIAPKTCTIHTTTTITITNMITTTIMVIRQVQVI